MCGSNNCRCEVSFQSYSPSEVEVGLQNAIFGGGGEVGGFFCGGRDLLTFGVYY